MILIGALLFAVAGFLILRSIFGADPTVSGLPRITFVEGLTIEVRGELPEATRRELADVAQMFGTTGNLTLVRPREVTCSSTGI